MNLDLIRKINSKLGGELLLLEYSGKLTLWNYDSSGRMIIKFLKKYLSYFIRLFTNKYLNNILPEDNKYLAPWIIYIARKK